MIIATTDGYIHFLSKCLVGKSHDYTQLKTEFSPEQLWFKDQVVGVDLGYQGIAKDYEQVNIPVKKPKNGGLTELEGVANQVKSSERIHVEHAIGRMKRFRYLSDRFCTHKVVL